MNETFTALLNELIKINQNIRPPMASKSTHFSIEQVAQIMNCSANNVRNWIKAGELRPFQYKGTLRIRVESLDRFITRYTG